MKIYLASSAKLQGRMREIREELWLMGHEVTARWLDVNIIPPDGISPGDTRHAAMDITDIMTSELMLVFTGEPSTTGGFHVEMGFAMGQQNPDVAIVGPITNIFQGFIKWFPDWEACKSALRDIPAERK